MTEPDTAPDQTSGPTAGPAGISWDDACHSMLSRAWEQTDPAALAAGLRALPVKVRGRMLSRLKTPASKVTPVTARLLNTNLARAGHRERLRAAETITGDIAHRLFHLAADAATFDEFVAQVHDLGAERGPSLVVLAAVAMVAGDDADGPAALAACRAAGFLEGELETAAAAVTADVEASFAARAQTSAGTDDADSLEQLWSDARRAAATLIEAVEAGERPGPADMGSLERFGAALAEQADRYGTAANVHAVHAASTAAELDATCGQIASQLRRLRGPESVADDLAAVAVPAAGLRSDPELAGRLAQLIEVVVGTDPAERFARVQTLRAAPEPPPRTLLDAALAGLLTLAPLDTTPDDGPGAEQRADDTEPTDTEPTSPSAPPAGPETSQAVLPAAESSPAGGPGDVGDRQGTATDQEQPSVSPPGRNGAAQPGRPERTPTSPHQADQPGAGPAETAVADTAADRPDTTSSAPTPSPGTAPATATADTATADTADDDADGAAADGSPIVDAGTQAPVDHPAPGDVPAAATAPPGPPRPAAVSGQAAPGHLAEAGDKLDSAQIGVILTGLVQARRYGLAHHLAAALGQDLRSQVLAEAALADAVRGPSSPAATELVERALSANIPADDRGSINLRVASAVRAALLDPASGAAEALRPLIDSLPNDRTLRRFVVAVVDASSRNVPLTADGAVIEDRARADAIASWAASALERPHQHLHYRGTEIWNRLVAPDGDYGRVLRLVAANDATHADTVRALCLSLNSPGARKSAIATADTALLAGRPGRRQRLTGQAAGQLVRNLADVVSQALAWCDALAATGDVNALEGLRAVAAELRQRLDGELYCGDDIWANAASCAAKASLAETIGLFSGAALPGDELEPGIALNGDLALIAGVRLGDDYDPPTAAPSAQTLAAAASVSIEAAFAARLAAGDLPEAEALAALAAHRGDPFAAAAGPAVASRERELRTLTSRRWHQSEAAFAAARARGRLSDETAAEIGGRLADCDPDQGRSDFGRIGDELTTLEAAIASAAVARGDAVTADLEDAIAEGALSDAWAARVSALLERDEVGAAEEYLHRARAGENPPEDLSVTHEPDRLLAEIISAHPEGVTEAVTDLVRAGGVTDLMDFSGLDDVTRESIAEALGAWRAMATSRPEPLEPLLGPVLRLLGLIPARIERPASLRAASSRTYWFVDVVGERSGHAYVPDYGTRAHQLRRFMLCWDTDLPPAQLWTLARANAPSDRPVYVLYFGALSTRARTELARHARAAAGPGVVFVDAAVMLRCAAEARQSYDVTMRATLPYAAPNPYDPNLLTGMPVEMFYGRSAERASVASPAGTSIISGGRRFGKSALLRAAAEELSGRDDVIVELIAIQDVAAPPRNDPAELWPRVAARLAEAGVLTADVDATADGVCGGIRAWLAANPSKRLLLLLDECDFFLRADADTNFANVIRLRNTMSEGDERFKVVFSGLQHVARYRRLPNQPLSHLPQPLVIGPLDAASASDLVRRPLHAIGWDITAAQVDRIVTYCACNPSVIQLACSGLLERLYRLDPDGLAPWPVPDAVVDELLASPEVAHGVRDRLFLTLELDHRYKLLAYLLAWRAATDGLAVAVPPAELRHWAVEWWPDGFASQRVYDVRALCDELVGLGVLAGDAENGYRMLSPGMVRVFGDVDEILDELVNCSDTYVTDRALGAAGNRMPLGGHRYSPLTASQLADVLGAGRTQLRVVVGSRATRVEAVGEALAAAARQQLVKADVTEVGALRQWRDAMRVPSSGHRVVISDLTSQVSQASWDDSVLSAQRRGGARTSRGTRAAVLVAGPSQRWLLRRLASRPDAAPGDLADVAVPLRRIDAASLQAWDRIAELDLSLPARQHRLLEVTGGWPLLVERVLAQRIPAGGLDRALDEVAAWLGSVEGAAALVAAVGLDVDDADQQADRGVAATFDRLVATGLRDQPAELAELLAIDDGLVGEDDPAEALAVLSLIGALDEDDDGVVGAEPVLASCWAARAALSHAG